MRDIRVVYEKDAEQFALRLFGRAFSADELAAAVGALDGSQLKVSIRKGSELAVEVKNARMIEQVRWVRTDDQGALCIWNFRLERARGYPGVGLTSLLRQINGARQLGVKKLECYAAGDPKSYETGYYRWALYGYDAWLTPAEQRQLARLSRFAGVHTLNALMLRDGEEWWRKNGSGRKMIFELKADSTMMVVLKQYLARKHPEFLKELQ